jgi:hypothetical protein
MTLCELSYSMRTVLKLMDLPFRLGCGGRIQLTLTTTDDLASPSTVPGLGTVLPPENGMEHPAQSKSISMCTDITITELLRRGRRSSACTVNHAPKRIADIWSVKGSLAFIRKHIRTEHIRLSYFRGF